MTAKPFRPTPAQQRALDIMRSRRDGAMASGEGFAVTTVEALEREGLCTVVKSNRADGILRRSRFPYFDAALTEKGWEGHERPAEPGPAYGEPTPADELRKGDTVVNIHTGGKGTWWGMNGLGSYTVEMGGASMHTQDGNWRLLERAPEPAEIPEVEPEPSAPQDPAEQRAVRDETGRAFAVGQRITWRTPDGYLLTGGITGFGIFDDGRRFVEFDADRRQVAPPARAPRGVDRKPGPVRTISPPEPTRVALDKRITPA